jgi:hypothetical protein
MTIVGSVKSSDADDAGARDVANTWATTIGLPSAVRPSLFVKERQDEQC